MAGIHVHLHLDGLGATQVAEFRNSLNELKEIMATTQAEHAQQLRDLLAQNEKARAEQATAFAALQEALANAGNLTPEVEAAMTDLKASIQAEDDANPDAPAGGETPEQPA